MSAPLRAILAGVEDMEQLWCDEVELDPAKAPVAMGTRTLGTRPWLIADGNREAELALKQQLSAERHDEVFAACGDVEEASRALAAAVIDVGVALIDDAGLHPLDRTGRSVQEDLCLMQRREAGWHLAAASLCFPSRWRLADKIDHHISAIHIPVEDYSAVLAQRVDQLFDRLHQPVWRRNWFVHGNPALFQPERPSEEPVVPASRVADDLVVRSERQVLRRVGPPGWIVFTIKTQQATLGAFWNDPGRAERFRTYLAETPAERLSHRGLSPAQVVEVRQAMTQLQLPHSR